MTRSISIGPNVHIDLDRLVSTRLLIQANSGAGKSWALRRLLEQTHGKIQQLVIDPEGEFSSLREKYDYVLAAKNGGDTAADPTRARAACSSRICSRPCREEEADVDREEVGPNRIYRRETHGQLRRCREDGTNMKQAAFYIIGMALILAANLQAQHDAIPMSIRRHVGLIAASCLLLSWAFRS